MSVDWVAGWRGIRTQAGQMLVEFYENSGIDNQKAIQFELSQHYDGGWEQFQADLNGGTESPRVSWRPQLLRR